MRANENERKKALRVVKTAFAALLMVGVSGCAGHGETFDCAPGIGAQCKSISQVNEMVDHTSSQEKLELEGQRSKLANVSSNVSPIDLVSGTRVSHPSWGGKRTLKVWVAPFTDMDGNFHETAIVHISQTGLPYGERSYDSSQSGKSLGDSQ